jgi:hypothetical protein
MNDLPSDEKKKDAKGEQKNNLKSFLSCCSKKKEKANSGGNERKNKNNSISPIWIQAILMAITAILIFFYTFFASQQVDEMRRANDQGWNAVVLTNIFGKKTAKEMTKQTTAMKIASAANEKAAGLAEKNIKTIQDQFRMEQRAFVHLNGFRPILPITDPKDKTKVVAYNISPVIQNSGATPTKNMHIHFNTFPSAQPLPDNFDYPDFGEKVLIPFFLAPHVEQESVPIKIPMEIITLIQNNSLHFYIYGWIRYRDRVGGKDVHSSDFCYDLSEITGDPTNPAPGAALFRFTGCPKHNCSDEECENK